MYVCRGDTVIILSAVDAIPNSPFPDPEAVSFDPDVRGKNPPPSRRKMAKFGSTP